MNGIIDAKDFAGALSRVMKLAAKRSAVPVLEQVKVAFTGTTCTLTATDLEQWGVITLAAQGDAFSFVLGSGKEVLKMLDKQNEPLHIAFTPDEKLPQVKLSCGGRESRLFVESAEDYPAMPSVEVVQTYHADSGMLLERVAAVSYAANTHSESRPAMAAVSFLGREIYCVDGYRMAVVNNDQMETEKPILIPVWMFKSWRALFPTGEVTLSVGKRYLQVTQGDACALFRLMEGETLRPQNVFPTSCRERYQVSPKEYARELAYLSGFVTQPIHQPVAFHGGRLSVMTGNGAYSAKISVEGTAEIVYGFQVGYMLEAMKAFEDQAYVTVEVSHPNGPIVLRADDGRKTLILPTRLKETAKQAA